jgi:histidine decarboxylase
MKLDRETAGFPAAMNREEKLARTFASLEQRIRAARATHLGAAYNLPPGPAVPDRLQGCLITSGAKAYGDAFDVGQQEAEAMAWLMRLWGCLDLDKFWGAIAASRAEANLWALYLGREMLPDAVLLHSAQAHPSVPGAARILRITAIEVASLPDGAMNIADFAGKVQVLAGRPVLVALTCGTTMKGAHDDIAGALSVLKAAGYRADQQFVHVDGALNAMVLPFLQDVPTAIQPSFEKDIDSMITLGHQMIGTLIPCAALVARKAHIARLAASDPNSTTLTTARNGHAVLAVWARVFGHGYGRFAHDAQRCVNRARQLAGDLAALGMPVLCNPFSLTVVFPEPPAGIVRRYHLACQNGQARAVIMPSVTDTVLAQFLADYTAWAGRRGLLH